ncbi:AbrB family transcriptional regulator [Corynebacterium sp. 4HC-13]|uniref:AbrB family transcriptional regulator n=1 Tax=Corynebacterium anserum TaxID=2684406 RepID=UPI00163B1395|nr:AbrB family transcriptional regulator [Corynebacterium anserum]MBC2681049.1 AbrB family transcriptional regulator [Corynebacterium anserum]
MSKRQSRQADRASGIFTRWARLAGLAVLAIIGGVLGEKVGVPAAWIFSFLVVFGMYAIFGDERVTPPKKAMIPSQAIISLLCAAPLATVGISSAASYVGAVIISLMTTFAVCALGSWLLVHCRKVTPATSVLSTMAGGASGMVMLANEMDDADIRFVTLTQYLRLSIVVLTLPAMVQLLGGIHSNGGGAGDIGEHTAWWDTSWQPVIGVVCTIAVVWLFTRATRRWFTVSSPYLLLSIAFLIVAHVIGLPAQFLTPDGLVVDVAYALIGIQAGGTLTKSALRQFARALPIIVNVVLLMIVSSLLAALGISALWDLTVLDSYLATVPGGIYAVLAFAHEAGSDPVVTVVQVMRMIAMLVVGAYAPQIIDTLRRRSEKTH